MVLRRQGGSLMVTIPPALVEYLGVQEGQKMVMKAEVSQRYGRYLGLGALKIADDKVFADDSTD